MTTQEKTLEPIKPVEGVYYCPVCGYGYADRETAEECREYCSTHASCSLEITKRAVRKPEL
jgi:rubrerythrin